MELVPWQASNACYEIFLGIYYISILQGIFYWVGSKSKPILVSNISPYTINGFEAPPPPFQSKKQARSAQRGVLMTFLYRNVFEYLIDKLPHAMDKGKAI